MRLLRKARNTDGSVEVKVSVGTSEDLWHLYNFVLVGDSVCTKTRRKVVRESVLGTQSGEMKTLNLYIEVEKTEFTPDEVRLQGVNCRENQYVPIGAHHTLAVHADPPQEVVIIKKEWDALCEARLKDACDESGKADTAALLMNYGETKVVLVTPSFMHIKADITVTIAKKHKSDGKSRDKSIEKFFRQSLEALATHVDFAKAKVVLICSPGNVREEFFTYVKETTQRAEHGALRTIFLNLSKCLLIRVSSTSIGGLRDALSDPGVAQRMQSTKCVDDIKVWGKFQELMSHDPDRCVYTPQFVFSAAFAGAVAHLMVSDDVFRSENIKVRRFFLALVHFVRLGGATVNVFSSRHVIGEQLIQLGSVAAVLTYAPPGLDDEEVNENFFDSDEVQEFIRENATAKVTQ